MVDGTVTEEGHKDGVWMNTDVVDEGGKVRNETGMVDWVGDKGKAKIVTGWVVEGIMFEE